MDATRIYLVRHGQVVNHHEFRYNGHTDVDVTEEGLDQMERLADHLAGSSVTSVYSSDLLRAVKGAETIGARLGLEPEKVPAFRELHLGRWEGLTREEAAGKYPEEAHFTFSKLAGDRIKGGESLVDLRSRVLPALDAIVDKHRGESVCMVLHGGVNRVILCEAMGLPLENFFRVEQDYGCLNVIDYFDDGGRVVKLLNGGPNQEMGTMVHY
ncbi:MAG: histidine phosphatase family protein [Thermodesulfobacteriota bacterium]